MGNVADTHRRVPLRWDEDAYQDAMDGMLHYTLDQARLALTGMPEAQRIIDALREDMSPTE